MCPNILEEQPRSFLISDYLLAWHKHYHLGELIDHHIKIVISPSGPWRHSPKDESALMEEELEAHFAINRLGCIAQYIPLHKSCHIVLHVRLVDIAL